MELRCIRDKCPKYFVTDIFEICQVNRQPIFCECVGYNSIDDVKEDLVCKIALLTNQVNGLCGLKDYIKDNQEE